MQHDTRYSDSSFYDVVCKVCGGTDASGDDRLRYPCTGSPSVGEVEAAKRKVARAKEALRVAEDELKELSS